MPNFSFEVRAHFTVIEGDSDWKNLLTRAGRLVADYEISEAELNGFNERAGTRVSTLSASLVPLESRVVDATRQIGEAEITLDIVANLTASDEIEAAGTGIDLLEFFNLDPYFLAGYNEKAGTRFTKFTRNDLAVATVSLAQE